MLNKVLLRLLLVNMALLIFSSLLLTAVYWRMFNNEINGQLHHLNRQVVKEFRNTLDNAVIKDVIRLTDVLLSDRQSNDLLIYPFAHDISSNTTRIMQTANYLKELAAAYPFVESVDMYYREGNLFFLGSNVCFMNLRQCDLNYRQDWFDRFHSSDGTVGWKLYRSTEDSAVKRIVTYVRGYPFFAGSAERRGMMAINLNEAYLLEFLQNYDVSGEQRLFILDPSGSDGSGIMTHSRDVPLPDDSLIASIVNSGAEEGLLTASLNGQRSVVSYSKSEFSPFYYISIVPAAELYKQSDELRNALIAVGTLLLLGNLLFAIVFTQRAHRPIRQIIKQYDSALDEMKERWDKHKSIIRQDYLLKVLHGYWEQGSSSGEKERLMNIRFDRESCLSFIIVLRWKELSSRDELLLPYRIIEGLENGLKPGSIYAVYTEQDPQRISGMLHFAGRDAAELLACMQESLRCQEEIEAYNIVTGSVYPCHPEHAARSYKEAAAAAEYSMLDENAVIACDRLRLAERREGGSCAHLYAQLEEAVRAGSGDKGKQVVRDIAAEMHADLYTAAFIRGMMRGSAAAVVKGLKGVRLDAEQLFGYDIVQHGAGLFSLRRYVSWMDEVLDACTAAVDASRSAGEALTEEKLRQYIENNLCNDISLESLSDYLGMNPNYVSKLFHTVMGKTFIEYVTDMKMQRASQLLIETKRTVQEIAELLGYRSTPHFIRVFKERYGLTPKQYQKRHQAS
ncbi:AraC family transcriptional regulator [Paenibacillus ginsengihumi]|uniref:AraC family transcriptional regulator n=1 Tax=Paenibacillus ginsengihumi TaxID=431596 RepID=UPI000363BBF7|nr:AraC family transcriptional regulator [Paenibacillus ginsengihumi]